MLGLPVSRRMRGLVYMASRDKVDVDTFHKGIPYALESRILRATSWYELRSAPLSNLRSGVFLQSLYLWSLATCAGTIAMFVRRD